MKILITGGAGFIGSNLAIELVKRGHEIRVLDILLEKVHGPNPSLTSPTYKSLLRYPIEIIIGSILDKDSLRSAVLDVEAIYHLASETGTGESMYRSALYSSVNVVGTALLLDVLREKKSKVKKLILSSSRSVYGEGSYQCSLHGIVTPPSRLESRLSKGDFGCYCPICDSEVDLIATKENAPFSSGSFYALTKQIQEDTMRIVAGSLEIPYVILRLQNVYGPGQSLNNPYTGILSIFSTLMRNSSDINIFEDGNESRDFVFITDVVKAFISALSTEDVANTTFNVGSGQPTSVLTIANYLKQAYSSNSKIEISGNFRLGDIRHNFSDLSNASKYLKYSPEVSIEEGIKLFAEWVLTQESSSSDDYYNSLEELSDLGLLK